MDASVVSTNEELKVLRKIAGYRTKGVPGVTLVFLLEILVSSNRMQHNL